MYYYIYSMYISYIIKLCIYIYMYVYIYIRKELCCSVYAWKILLWLQNVSAKPSQTRWTRCLRRPTIIRSEFQHLLSCGNCLKMGLTMGNDGVNNGDIHWLTMVNNGMIWEDTFWQFVT